MKQSKSASLLEGSLNVFSGFIFSFVIWAFIVSPMYGIETTMLDNLGITSVFTAFSLVRGYAWRRLFNYYSK